MVMLNRYDVIVVGGGTAGCSAAYNAAKLGLKTLLIEKHIHLGGSITSGLVMPAMQSSDNQINTDFFYDLISELKKYNAQITYQNNPGWFDPEICKVVLDTLMQKVGVEVIFDSRVTGVNIYDNLINNLIVSSNMLSECIATRYVIDATANCEVGFLSGCKFIDKNDELQPVSLRFEMSGIDIKKFSDWIINFDLDRNVTSACIINDEIHLSTAYTSNGKWSLKPLFDDAIDKNILLDEDRQYFQIFTIPGRQSCMAFNCPRVYFPIEINPLCNTEQSKALQKARKSIIRIAKFCKIYFPGFEKSYISNIADTLGVRVSRRIKGKYIYTVNDLKSGRKFKNAVVIGNYPIDIHSNKPNESVLEHTLQDYYLPIEALISQDYDNLFVAGRCLSADFQAQAALRIQPSCFSMGEGVAKHIANLINSQL